MKELIAEAARFANVPAEDIQRIRSPYRVCPLGAHIDHQLGRVAGLALNHAVTLAFVPTDEPLIRLRSHEYNHEVTFSLAEAEGEKTSWARYAAGAVCALHNKGMQVFRGFSGVVSGSLPIGGLSSSAAVSLAYLLALEASNNLNLTAWENITLQQFIENKHIGLNNGILDQAIIMLSQQDHLVSLDCQSHEWELIPQAKNTELNIAVAYSGVSSTLTGTGYNTRVSECEEAATELLRLAGIPLPEQPRLRHVPPEAYETFIDQIPKVPARRARHFFTENARVAEGCIAWAKGDLKKFGQLITESGKSSIENYECGSPELITLYEILCATDGVYGARFSGGGFRGSCIALYQPGAEDAIRQAVSEAFPKAHPHLAGEFGLYFCKSSDGAKLL